MVNEERGKRGGYGRRKRGKLGEPSSTCGLFRVRTTKSREMVSKGSKQRLIKANYVHRL